MTESTEQPNVHQREHRECQQRASGYGVEGYPCHREFGHRGPHEVLDKDDCPHRWGGQND